MSDNWKIEFYKKPFLTLKTIFVTFLLMSKVNLSEGVVSSPTLTDKVAKMIRQDILLGNLEPGRKLVVAELKDNYDVGASPIREALVQLSWKKFVQLEPQKGCWVAKVSQQELNDLFESLRVIGRVLLEKAIQSGDESWELNILTSYHKLSRINLHSDSPDMEEWEERHSQFQLSLLEGSNSHIMYNFYRDICNQLERYRHLWLSKVKAGEEQYHDIDKHEAIMKAVLARDLSKASELIELHLEHTANMLEKYIEA